MDTREGVLECFAVFFHTTFCVKYVHIYPCTVLPQCSVLITIYRLLFLLPPQIKSDLIAAFYGPAVTPYLLYPKTETGISLFHGLEAIFLAYVFFPRAEIRHTSRTTPSCTMYISS